jgi:putative methyltransferase (TIGR04325 family)
MAGQALYRKVKGIIVLHASLKWARDVYRYLTFGVSQFRGVYDNFRQAEAAVPRGRRIGYNYKDLAQQYRAELTLHLDNSDYPILYHLTRILADQCAILDFGGNIGIHYLQYKKYLCLEGIRWIVCDVPEITKVGQETCADQSNVAFVNDIDQLNESRIDVFLARGSLQYVESPDLLITNLANKGIRPRHILIDLLPLYGGTRFVTLQNGGPVYYPQYVFNREEYISAITNLGYELIDFWDCSNHPCIIPFHRAKSFRAYSGLYFRDREMDHARDRERET